MINFYQNILENHKKPLTIALTGGFSNRLCTLISSKIACNKMDRRLSIYWSKNKNCGCYLDDLFIHKFETIKKVEKQDFDDWNKFCKYLSSNHKTMFYVDKNFKYFEKVLIDSDRANFENGVPLPILKLFSKELNSLRVKPEIINKMMILPKNTIGLHIRKADFLCKRKQINYNWFTKMIDAEIVNNKDVIFFLATDSVEVKKNLQSLYNGRILFYDFKLNTDDKNFLVQRSNVAGMQDALIDLLTLSKTKKIYGSYGSSYSWIASMWGNIDLICDNIEFKR